MSCCAAGPCGRTTEGPGMELQDGKWVCTLCDVVARLPQPKFKGKADRRKRGYMDDIVAAPLADNQEELDFSEEEG